MSLEEEVIELVAKKAGIPRNRITPDKTFYDLGIDGEDAVELVRAISSASRRNRP